MKGVDNALLPYKKDKGLRAIFYLALAIVILCRRSIYRRLLFVPALQTIMIGGFK